MQVLQVFHHYWTIYCTFSKQIKDSAYLLWNMLILVWPEIVTLFIWCIINFNLQQRENLKQYMVQ